MSESARDRLVADIRHLIDTRYDGRVVKPYLTQLATAVKSGTAR